MTTNDAPYYGAKVDWNITPNHRLEGTYLIDETGLGTDRYEYDHDTRTQGAYVGSGTQDRGGTNYIGKYTGIFTENFLVSGQYGDNQFDRTDSSTARRLLLRLRLPRRQRDPDRLLGQLADRPGR